MRRSPIRRWWLPLPLLLLAGCGHDADVIATVGRREVLREDVLATASALSGRQNLPPDSLRAQIVNALIQREILAQAAEAEGLHRDTLFLDYKRNTERQSRRTRLLGDLAGPPVEASEAEIEEFHRWRGMETRARAIFAFNRVGAEAALAQIQGGVEFGAVADRFNPTGFTPPGGDLGYLAPGYLQQPLDDVIRTAQPGTVVGPIDAAPQGWFLIRVEDRRPHQQEPLESERATLAQVIRQRKQRLLLLRAVDRLKAQYDLRVLNGAAPELAVRVMASGDTVPPLSDSDRALTLGTYRGGVYTLGDAMEELREGQVARPDFRTTATVQRWLESRLFDRVLALEAEARHYQDEPIEVRGLRAQLDDYLLQSYYTRHILSVMPIDTALGKALYDAEAAGHVGLREVRILMTALRDSGAASRLTEAARRTSNLRAAVQAQGLDAAVRAETVRLPSTNPVWIALEPSFRDLAPGAVGGPYPIPGGLLVIQMVSKDQGAVRFEELPEVARQNYVNQANQERRVARLRALTDSLRSVIPVTVHNDRLKRLDLSRVGPG